MRSKGLPSDRLQTQKSGSKLKKKIDLKREKKIYVEERRVERVCCGEDLHDKRDRELKRERERGV